MSNALNTGTTGDIDSPEAGVPEAKSVLDLVDYSNIADSLKNLTPDQLAAVKGEAEYAISDLEKTTDQNEGRGNNFDYIRSDTLGKMKTLLFMVDMTLNQGNSGAGNENVVTGGTDTMVPGETIAP